MQWRRECGLRRGSRWIDPAAVRNTQDVDLLLRRSDFDAATKALAAVGCVRRHDAGIDVFLDGPNSKARDAVHVVPAGEKIRPDYLVASPDVSESEKPDQFRLLSLDALVRMKLTSFRDKDRTHLRDMLDVGLIDATWKIASTDPIWRPLAAIARHAGRIENSQTLRKREDVKRDRTCFITSSRFTKSRPKRRSAQPRRLFQSQHQIRILNRLPCVAFSEIVDRAHRDHDAAFRVRGIGHIRQIRSRRPFAVRRLVEHAHEAPPGIKRAGCFLTCRRRCLAPAITRRGRNPARHRNQVRRESQRRRRTGKLR